MIGRACCAAIARTTGSLKAPGWPETPISAVGLAWSTTSISETMSPEAATVPRG